MSWPDKPTIHVVNAVFHIARDICWRQPRVDQKMGEVATFRTCSYCGSIHPADLLAALSIGKATLHGSDWKYGYPHKLYVEGMPNLFEGEQCERGSSYKDGVSTPILGKPPAFIHGKFYTEHFLDEGFGVAELTALSDAVEDSSGIRFVVRLDEIKGRALQYRAPCHGYQRG